jgi:hypothetical protein
VEQNHCENGKGSYQSEDMFYRDTFKVESSFKNVVKKVQCVKTLILSMAGKTGTAAVNYAKDGGSGKYYASSLWVIFRLIILNILVLS